MKVLTEGQLESKIGKRRPKHPDFKFTTGRNFRTPGHAVVIFERSVFKRPTEQQIEEYRKNQEVVEAHGGRMRVPEYEIAGENQVFTEADCQAMREAVAKAFPDFVVGDCWNGVGCLSYSVSMTLKESR